jgi:hypothetical protein
LGSVQSAIDDAGGISMVDTIDNRQTRSPRQHTLAAAAGEADPARAAVSPRDPAEGNVEVLGRGRRRHRSLRAETSQNPWEIGPFRPGKGKGESDW